MLQVARVSSVCRLKAGYHEGPSSSITSTAAPRSAHFDIRAHVECQECRHFFARTELRPCASTLKNRQVPSISLAPSEKNSVDPEPRRPSASGEMRASLRRAASTSWEEMTPEEASGRAEAGRSDGYTGFPKWVVSEVIWS